MRGGGGMRPLSDEVEKRARQRLEALDSKHGLKLAGNGSSKSGKHSKMSSNGSALKSKSSKKRRRASSDSSSGEEDTDWSNSVGPSSASESDSDDGARKSRKRRKSTRAKAGGSSSDESSSDGLSSESEDKSRYCLFSPCRSVLGEVFCSESFFVENELKFYNHV